MLKETLQSNTHTLFAHAHMRRVVAATVVATIVIVSVVVGRLIKYYYSYSDLYSYS